MLPTFRIDRPQIAVMAFLVILLGLAVFIGIEPRQLISDSLVRLVMNGVLVLSLLPMLRAGIGMNYGLPVAITAGLLGLCLAVNFHLTGMFGLFIALVASVLFAVIVGYCYGRILNHVKGREEITGTFIGFAFIPIMNFFWAVAPFHNPVMLWPIGGKGLRPTINLQNYFLKELNHLWNLDILGIYIPVGLLLFFVLCCLVVKVVFKSKSGLSMIILGENAEYAEQLGLNCNRLRLMAIILSTILGAVGICVYAQSYGFIELYEAPQMMAFPAASAILVGGSRGTATSLLHVILGTYLFQTIYLISGPIANEILVPEAAEIFRLLITNAVILYALMHDGRKTKFNM